MKTLDVARTERAELLRVWHTKDPANDGRFLVGVVTTGIYCLPSCTARQPKDENVRFFADEGGAQSFGLRACKRCRPDHFYRGYDPERLGAEALAEEIRARPQDFADVSDMKRAAGVGATKLVDLFRRHFHTTPAAFLHRARLATAATELVRSERRVLDVALDAGFESSSAFHEGFTRQFGMPPSAYRRLPESRQFSLRLPDGLDTSAIFSLFGRDEAGVNERIEGRRATKALRIAGKPARLGLAFTAGRVKVDVEGGGRASRGLMVDAHARVVRMLGLAADPGPFVRRVRRLKGMTRLVRGREGLRISMTPNAFEGLVWVVVGQQVNLTFASTCRVRLIELCGEPAGGGQIAHPTPEAVAQLDYPALERLQYSRRKAEYVIDTARQIASGELDLEGLGRHSALTVEEGLGAVRGLGPWSIHYLLMRSFGFEDCVPVGDAGLVAALQRFFDLEARPDPRETLRLMEPFAPHRSLATYHLWRSLGDDE